MERPSEKLASSPVTPQNGPKPDHRSELLPVVVPQLTPATPFSSNPLPSGISQRTGSSNSREQQKVEVKALNSQHKSAHHHGSSATRSNPQRDDTEMQPQTPSREEVVSKDPPSSGTRSRVREPQKTAMDLPAAQPAMAQSGHSHLDPAQAVLRNTPGQARPLTSPQAKQNSTPVTKGKTPVTPRTVVRLNLGCASRAGDIPSKKRPASETLKETRRVVDRVVIPPRNKDSTGGSIPGKAPQLSKSALGKPSQSREQSTTSAKDNKKQTTLPFQRTKGKEKIDASTRISTHVPSRSQSSINATTSDSEGEESSEVSDDTEDADVEDDDYESFEDDSDVEEVQQIQQKEESDDRRNTPERLMGLPAGAWPKEELGKMPKISREDQDLIMDGVHGESQGGQRYQSPVGRQLHDELRKSIHAGHDNDGDYPSDNYPSDNSYGTRVDPSSDESTKEHMRRLREEGAKKTAEHDVQARKRWKKTQRILAEKEESDVDARRPAPDLSRMVYHHASNEESADEEIIRRTPDQGRTHRRPQRHSQYDGANDSEPNSSPPVATPSQEHPLSFAQSSQRSVRTADLRPEFPSSGKVKSQTPASSGTSRGSKSRLNDARAAQHVTNMASQRSVETIGGTLSVLEDDWDLCQEYDLPGLREGESIR